MNSDPIIEAAARALYRILYPYSTSFVEEHFAWYHKAKVNDLALAEQSNVAKTFRDVRDILTAVTPLIEEAALKRWHHDLAYVEAAALEEAIRVTEKHFVGIFTGWVGHAPITLEEAETIANECSLLCAADIRALRRERA